MGTGDGVIGQVRLWDKRPRASDCATVASDIVLPAGEEGTFYRAMDITNAGGGPVELLRSFHVDESDFATTDHLYDDYRVIVAAGSTSKCMRVEQKFFFGFPLPATCAQTSVRLPTSGVLRGYQLSNLFQNPSPVYYRTDPHEIANGVRDIDLVVKRLNTCGYASCPVVQSHLALAYEGRSSLSKNQLVYTTHLITDGVDLLAGDGTLVGQTVKENFDQVASFNFGGQGRP